MEKGLLSRLQSYFSASFGGRYVEYLLKETIEEQPRLAARLFGVRRFDELQVEYRFRTDGRTRIADLAFVDAQAKQPTCLVEIKYDDHRNPKNAAQVKDYLKFCRRENCKYVLLSQHLPPAHLRKGVPQKGLVLFSDLADRLRSDDGSVGALLRRFFVDQGLVMHKFASRDLANLRSFLFRLFNPWLGSGRSHRKEAMSGGGAAEAFGHLLRNMNIIAKEVAADLPGRAPTIDFEVAPWVKPKLVQKIAEEDPDANSVNAYRAKAGGDLFVYGRIRLDDRSSSWLQVEFGIGLDVNPGDRDFSPLTFAGVYSNFFGGEGSYSEKDAPMRVIYDKRRAVIALKKRINEVVQMAIKRAPPKAQAQKLRRFRDALHQNKPS